MKNHNKLLIILLAIICISFSALAATDTDVIVNEVQNLLDNESEYKRMSEAINPYGDGLACGRIIDFLR